MGTGRARLAASILDADLSNLAHAVRRAEKAGADRIHLDVMDGHFVPNLTFGAKTVKALRRVTRLPFDAHLMISEPGRYVEEFIDAGCDSITVHAEVAEPLRPIIQAVHRAGRAAGLAIKPATSVAVLEPYRRQLDIVLVMCVEPGFGGQHLMVDAARKALAARDLFGDRAWGGEIHADGGVNRDTAELVGGLGYDVLVAGSALFTKGHDIGREVRLIKALADEGYQYRLNGGVPPIPRDNWVSFASLPKAIGKRLAAEIERGGIPVIQLRTDGRINPDGVRDYELLVPASAEAAAVRYWGEARQRAEAEAGAWRASFPIEGTAPAEASSLQDRGGVAAGEPARRTR
ncbi:MAG TPA: ribulose-phosphate 3-epimerase [Candidatus Limnocylindrales bacterium]